jgi:hypothetical protein
LPRNLKKLKLNHVDLISKIASAQYYPQGLARELLSLRGTPGTKINISQNEKLTEIYRALRVSPFGRSSHSGNLPIKIWLKLFAKGRGGGVHIYFILW